MRIPTGGNVYFSKEGYARTRAGWTEALRLNPNDTTVRDNIEIQRQNGC
jgi:hypothetical protein